MTDTFAYLVVYDRGGLGGAFLDETRAHEYARNTDSVVVQVPIIGDYRKATSTEWKEPS